MCLSDLGRVVAVDATSHSVSVDIGDRVVSVSTVTLGLDAPAPDVGDWLVIHTGFAIERLSDTAATAVLRTRDELTAKEQR